MTELEVKDYGLIINPPEPEHWEVGSGQATKRLGAGEINPSGNWLQYITEDEKQAKNGLDTFNCTNFGTIKALIALARHLNFIYVPKNCSERYTGVCTGTVPGQGNDPWKVIETIAKKCGLISEQLLPFSDNIHDYDEYYSPSPMAEEFIKEGERVLRKYNINWEWVFNAFSGKTPEQKRAMLKAALKRGPVCVSVRAWEKEGGVYTKLPGADDTHWVILTKYDGDTPIIHDQYSPFVKKLDKDYDFTVAILYFMTPNTSGVLPKDVPLYIKLLRQLITLLTEVKNKVGSWIRG